MVKAFAEFLEGNTILYFDNEDDIRQFLDYASSQGARHQAREYLPPEWFYRERQKYGLGFNKSLNSLWVIATNGDALSMRDGEKNSPPLQKVNFHPSMLNESGFYWR